MSEFACRYALKNHEEHVIVEAMRLTPDNVAEVANWSGAQIVEEKDSLTHEVFEGLNVRTPYGKRRASLGMYVVKWQDTFAVQYPSIFEAAYTVVT